jgi:hypothetical protein
MTFARMQQIALGMVGISPQALWQMTEAEFYYMASGYFEQIEQRVEMQKILTREMWEMTRWEAWSIINHWLARKDRYTSPDKLMRFPWEKQIKKRKLSARQFDEKITKRLGKTFK